MSGLLQEADWPAPAGVHGLVTLRGAPGSAASQPPFDAFNLGMNCGDDPAAVTANRERLRQVAQLPGEPCWLRQVHGTRVLRWQRDRDGRAFAADADGGMAPIPERSGPVAGVDAAAPEADASVTSEPGMALAVLSADCLPVLLCSDAGDEVGAAHAGWRGLAAGVVERTVAAMRVPPSRLIAWLGPAAGPDHYEVGVEVRDAFLSHDPAAVAAFAPTRPGHWKVDLYALARRRLAAAGVSRVHGGTRCTIGEPSWFFSHRRDARTGRMASLVWRAERAPR